METITITVDEDVARAFRDADPHERLKLQALVNAWLKQTMKGRMLDEIIRDVQAQAQASGLTSELLEQLLQDE